MTAVSLLTSYLDAYLAWFDALARGGSSFRHLLDDNWFGTDRHGTTFDAADWRRFAGVQPADAVIVEQEVMVHDGFAIVRGTIRHADEEVRFVSLWRRAAGSIRCLTHHETLAIGSPFDDRPATTRLEERPLGSSASRGTIDELTSKYEEMHATMSGRDFDRLAGMLRHDWFTTDPGGDVRDKRQYIEFGRAYYAPTLTFELGELFVREAEPFAVVSCRYTLGGRFRHGVAPNRAVRVTGIWRREGDGWAYAAQQGSFIP